MLDFCTTLSGFLEGNTDFFTSEEREKLTSNYGKYDITITQSGSSYCRSGKIYISLKTASRFAELTGFPWKMIFEYALEHETTHFRLGHCNKKAPERRIIYKENQERSLKIALNERVKMEKEVHKNAKEFPCSETINKEALKMYRKAHKNTIETLKEKGKVVLQYKCCGASKG